MNSKPTYEVHTINEGMSILFRDTSESKSINFPNGCSLTLTAFSGGFIVVGMNPRNESYTFEKFEIRGYLRMRILHWLHFWGCERYSVCETGTTLH